MTTLYTIGYQGRDLDSFVQTLRDHGIATLADVRRKALSRKKGFSKTALRNGVEAAGIAYVHIPELGMPLDLFHDRNNTAILEEYRVRLELDPVEVDNLAELILSTPTCLMCFEADIQQCHRRVLAEIVAPRINADIAHI